MSSTDATTSRMYIHRRFVVRFLIVLLVLLSAASFVSIALGLGLAPTASPQEDSSTPTKLSDTSPFYVLLVGSDSLAGTALYTGGVGSNSRADEPQADSLLLARVDPGECVITFVTVPSNTVLEDSDELVRDTLSADGPQRTVRTVERITGVNIRYWFLMDFSAFEALVDQVGGITADVPVSMTMQDPLTAKPTTVPAGTDVALDEAGTLVYLRSSDPYVADADPHRQLNVRDALSQMIFEVLSLGDDDVRLILGVFEDVVDTNIDNATLISLVTRFYDEKEAVRIYSCTGPYLASTINKDGEPIVEQQTTAWRELMTVVDSGEDPAQVLPQYDFKGSESDYVKPEEPASSSSRLVAESSSSAAASASSSSSGSASGSKKKSGD